KDIELLLTDRRIDSKTLALDIREKESIDKIINTAIQAYGSIDILCNNAGIMDGAMSVAETSDELWNRVMDINLKAPFRATRAVIPQMLKQKHGIILNTASVAGLYGGKAGVSYTVSKHGLIGLTKHMAAFYGTQGIRCNAMALGAVKTNIGIGSKQPDDMGLKIIQKTFGAMPEPADAGQIAKIALFLVSEQSEYLNGTVLVADSGWTVY
ncbi:SDR family oxidoreductase, partial [Ferroplasma acidiphilum]|uniref:SDR family oxidoreductase n=1 Tax=Ferroplasma acidiphilum TaxID=74969 RepID=UPI0023F42335